MSICQQRLCLFPLKRRCGYDPSEISEEEKAEQKRQQIEAIEEGKSLGWTTKHAVKYAKALMRWIAAGRPVRTDDEVAEIVAMCEACKHYKAKQKRCSVCGCRVSTGKLAVFNKCRLLTEFCPWGKW